MKMPCGRVIALGCWVIGSAMAQARIGETEKQCEERYGKPITTDRDQSAQIFRKAEFLVVAHFYEGRCDVIMFRKAADNEKKVKELSDDEREVLLRANGTGKEWKKMETVGEEILFATEDGEVRAQYNLSNYSLVIFTREGGKRKEEARKGALENKLKGF